MTGLAIAGLRGGTGKTVISLGITAAWKADGLKVAPFKKGPDYIDAGWLAQAAGRPCYNLDTFMCTPQQVRHSFLKNSLDSDIALIEGNRGLYDCIDVQGETSTAEIAKFLKIPLFLIVDCTKSTRTIAALVMGCTHFDPDLNIMGIVLNRVAGKRHEGKVRDNIEKHCGIPVFGAVPKLTSRDFPERHMGLVPSAEHRFTDASIKAVAKIARDNINLKGLYESSLTVSRELSDESVQSHPPFIPGRTDSAPGDIVFTTACRSYEKAPVIGVLKDSAFQFYYPDNLEALEHEGARLKMISPLRDKRLPEVDALYIGGGFPETHAGKLAANRSFCEDVKRSAKAGMPIYAECGGLMFLGKSLRLDNQSFPMAGVLPIVFGLSKKPVGHGYTKVTVIHSNPFFKIGEKIKGHEFRYSKVLDIDFHQKDMVFSMDRGKGIIDQLDGFCWKNVLGTYTHIHAAGMPVWAEALVDRALEYGNLTGRIKTSAPVF
ncbi:MAG: cobyrinate a,c-diamide synthase [Thermodesulfobacteriota bacterium]|nr:cobyrinate a,c-diamide synthase [Thermodesulfobacteriota bacterium]